MEGSQAREDKGWHAVGFAELMLAASKGRASMVEVLSELGVDVNAVDQDGITALRHASLKGHTRTVEALAKHGAHMDDADEGGNTSMMLAAAFGHAETVETLARFGADPNVANPHGFTAVMFAASNGHTRTVEALVHKLGASVDIADKCGRTAATIAETHRHTTTANVLNEILHKQRLEQERKANLMAEELLREEAEAISKCKDKKPKKTVFQKEPTAAASPRVHEGKEAAQAGKMASEGQYSGGRAEAVGKETAEYGDEESGGKREAGNTKKKRRKSSKKKRLGNSEPGQDNKNESPEQEREANARDGDGQTEASTSSREINGAKSQFLSTPNLTGAAAAVEGSWPLTAWSPLTVDDGPCPAAGGSVGEDERGMVLNAVELECCVCMEARKSSVLMPCAHLCVCEGCADLIMATTKTCPICRQASVSWLKIFM